MIAEPRSYSPSFSHPSCSLPWPAFCSSAGCAWRGRGALRVGGARVRAAADLATLVAVNDQDDAELARSGALRLAADAADVARDYFARELELSAPLLDGAADDIAGA